jgi:hypothetical protein
MARALRFILIILMVAAVPLKGLAAARMIGCGPDHPSRAAALVKPGHVAHGHEGHQGAVHEHSDGENAADMQPAQQMTGDLVGEADSSARAGDADERTALTKCSSCAPCCAAAAPANSVSALPAVPPSNDVPTGAHEQRSSVTAGVPFKPPRHFLA